MLVFSSLKIVGIFMAFCSLCLLMPVASWTLLASVKSVIFNRVEMSTWHSPMSHGLDIEYLTCFDVESVESVY